MSAWSLPPLPDLTELLAQLLDQVPAGRVTTYGDLATALGDVRAARWVAQALSDAPLSEHRAAHRVLRQTGVIVEAATAQRQQLIDEGCRFRAVWQVDMEAARSAFASPRPLTVLSAWQLRMSAAAELTPWSAPPATIGGVDLSYASSSEAVAAYVRIDVATGDVLFSHTLRRATPFPYIPGYLTFREAPVLVDLLADVRQQGRLDSLILVDGSGRLHPRRAGIAVAVGMLAGCATIGVSKHQLCGRRTEQLVEGCPIIEHDEEAVGAVMDGGSKRRTLFVSPGQGIDLASAVRCTQAVWRNQRLPLPTFHADRLSRTVVRSVS
jgi:deoxyribonuclease V